MTLDVVAVRLPGRALWAVDLLTLVPGLGTCKAFRFAVTGLVSYVVSVGFACPAYSPTGGSVLLVQAYHNILIGTTLPFPVWL